ncbi:MAG: phosphate/phosphite/phosphonate ABC transporter substrate-binding protein [Woeseiaceae bacterium]|nr:phosphate/phosphite/phosphonate ABC transporter substrate-binding protein [Woeseiaceae bacterium]
MKSCTCRFVLMAAAWFTPMLAAAPALAAVSELVLGVAPLVGEEETRRQFAPLCTYLARTTGLPCRVATRPNFLSYWETMRRGSEYNLILDDAHFTDYRVRKMNYAVLVKIPDTVTYSLVVLRNSKIASPFGLVGRRIATYGIPSMGAAQLNSLFPQPSKQPIPVEVDDARQAFAMLADGSVAAAILPTPLIRSEMLRGTGFRVLLSTVPIPHMGLSAAPEIAPALRKAVREALLAAHKDPEGKQVLTQIGIPRFDPANGTIYKGQAHILQTYWGY